MYAFDFPLDLAGGYHIIKDKDFMNQCGDQFYDIYHTIICQQIEQNNIKGVNGLIRWIDLIGYFPDNQLLFEHALLHGTYEMFLMIYYICLFWGNDDDDQLYLQSAYIQPLLTNQISFYKLKYDFINRMISQHGKLFLGMDEISIQALTESDQQYDWSQIEYDKYEKYIRDILLTYDVDMPQINRDFYNTCRDKYNELSS